MPPPPYSLHIPLPVAAPMLAVADAATAAVLARCRLCTTARAPRSHFFLVPTLRRGAVAKRSKKFEKVLHFYGLKGVVWPCVRWSAAPSWCPVPGGSDLMLPAGAWLNTEVRSHQDQRQESTLKSEGKTINYRRKKKKRTSSSSAGPGGRQDTIKRNTTLQR